MYGSPLALIPIRPGRGLRNDSPAEESTEEPLTGRERGYILLLLSSNFFERNADFECVAMSDSEAVDAANGEWEAEDSVPAIHIVDTLEALRVLSDPRKLQIIEAVRHDALTASQIAKRLGEKPTKLYYHVAELERHQLIRVAETRQKGNLVEKYYRPAADVYKVDKALFEKGPEALGAFYTTVTGMLDGTTAHLKRAIDSGRVTEKEAAAATRVIVRSRLSASDAAEFQLRLREVIHEFIGKRSTDDAQVPIALSLLVYTERPEDEEPST